MVPQRKKATLSGVILVVFLLLGTYGCASSNGSSSNSTGGGNTGTSPSQTQGTASSTVGTTTTVTVVTPRQVTPQVARGSTGSGPLVISSPTPVPGGKAGSQQIVLGDRTLIISSVSQQNEASTNSTLITLALTVQNTSDKTIMNQATFFQLVGSEGDIFGYQYNSSDSFYGNITAHTSRTGTIMFQVPAAAATNVRLLYRPEIAGETTVVALH